MLSKIVFSKFIVVLWLSNTLYAPQLSAFQPPKYLAPKFSRDPQTLKLASTDFGHIIHNTPWAVFEPSSVSDISDLINFSNSLSTPFTIAPRGRAHSNLGQAMAQGDGVVLNMTNLKNFRKGSGISVSCSPSGFCYADVGGEQLWIDVLHASLKHGLTPLSFGNYLYLTVGGTLSNAGISGRAFRFGPQISNVLELDVVTGKGELVTCSPEKDSKLFFAALGGLGQFGVITRARIPLAPAPTRANQEYLTSFSERSDTNAPDFVNGQLLFSNQSHLELSPYPISDQQRIISLVTNHGIIYVLELAKYYDKKSRARAEEEVANLVKRLNFLPTFSYKSDASYVEFLERVHTWELEQKQLGTWDAPHAWLNMFVPSSRISDVNEGALKGIILKQNPSPGIGEIYPMNRNNAGGIVVVANVEMGPIEWLGRRNPQEGMLAPEVSQTHAQPYLIKPMVQPPRRPPTPPPTDATQLARAIEALAAAMLQQSQTITQQAARFDHLMHLYPPEIVEERTCRWFEEDSRPGIPRMVIPVIVAQTEERLDRGGRVAKGQFGGSSSDRGGRRRNLSITPYHRPQQPQQCPPAEQIHARFGVPPTP
ncbi:hypothetical protein Fmac_020623 [Flemingia macrophylla]|uniref:cytokinin dehydrogenase n=1 Tax=Flemingia macrophylla TaxID=520843 RepID=A0ABD1LUI6_9FABA